MHGDFYDLFDSYWWLLFPFFWMVFAMVKLCLRHARADRALDLIKSYADQGKEPPPELLAALSQPEPDRRAIQWGRTFGTYGWIPHFACAGCAIGLTYMAWQEHWDEGTRYGRYHDGCRGTGLLRGYGGEPSQ